MKPTIDTITLNLRKLAIQHRISGQLLDDLRLDARQDALNYTAEQMVLALATRVQTHNLPPDQITETRSHTTTQPATWWQHWKQDHAPQWWLRRWPVRETATEHTLVVTVNLRRFHVYPDAPAIPHDGYTIAIPNHELWTTVAWITEDDQP